MKHVVLIFLFAAVFLRFGFSQERIYRCGNEYTNTLANAKTLGCKLMDSGNVTIVQGTRPAASPVVTPVSTSQGQRVDAADQKSRDADARQILLAELKKAEMRQAELLKEYNNGAPEKRGGETLNDPKYLNRLADIKANLARNESDLAGIRRELGRMGLALATPTLK
jgi:hypothetical protein